MRLFKFNLFIVALILATVLTACGGASANQSGSGDQTLKVEPLQFRMSKFSSIFEIILHPKKD
ncbi:hypothetical protein KSF_064340 [Reticulibacter mediterranei]|uniref:Uncharacterized protein n=1 Tax=Reticulibacter mediterranei TaxID=2778369 RepID=A0A8J3IKW8_9CHLR|nr:hypothetical protein [Reticulibacter mediterranei]GHO96386.1 hypothetical protein KSF_064340 [Reticulibacter mediterranei]